MRFLLVMCLAIAALFCSGHSLAQEDPLFKTYNRDIDKYSFTKNFILSISYYKRVADRLKVEEALKLDGTSDIKVIQKFINDRTLDNTELRIARNYLIKFTSSRNGLIQQVARQSISAYDGVLALSMRERELWQSLSRFKLTGEPEDFNEKDFIEQQLSIAAQKKEADKMLLSASMLIRIVLLSAERCGSEVCQELALSRDERFKLTGYLDDFSRDNLEWGIKPGQTPIEGCVAAIREVLEDEQVFISKDK